MGSVHQAINNLGVEVIIIPPGCTGLVQPVDVGYNKPFKNLVHDQYDEWMVHESEDLTKPPRRTDIAQWVSAAEQKMKGSTIINAWMRHDLEYFPRTSIEVQVPPVINVPIMAENDATNRISDIEDESEDGSAVMEI